MKNRTKAKRARIVQAQKVGFCFGVKRAVMMAQAALRDKGNISSLGSIIHNKQVVQDLAGKGLKVVNDISAINGGVVVISSHGISPRVASGIAKRGIKIIDTTCPFVLKAQNIASQLSKEKYTVVIVGDSHHPEIKALVDFIHGKAFIVKDKKEAGTLKFGPDEKVSIISQTTQSTENFLEVVKMVLSKGPKELRVFNTICKDAEERQKLASNLARKVDLMLVVGGKNSANTRRLFEVCRKILKNSHLLETEAELKKSWIRPGQASPERGRAISGGQVIGITSGASTPDWMIERVVNKIKKLKKSDTSW